MTFTLDSRKFEYIDSGISTPKKAAAAGVEAKKQPLQSDEQKPAGAA